MSWLQVTVATTAEHTQAVEDALAAAGAASVTLEADDDGILLEPAPGETPLWAETRVVGLFDAATEHDAIRDALIPLGDEAAAEPVFELLPEREWTRVWLQDWQPLRFGPGLWVAPTDVEVEDARDDAGATIVRLDPGLAFGTGTHATTALCLEWLSRQALSGARVLDFGCGSGILAIAALRLGAARALGIDIDPQAVEAATANAALNGVGEQLTTATGDVPGGGPYDVVLANVLAGPLIEASAALARCQGPGGRIVLAGILADQVERVRTAFEEGYSVDVGPEREGWALVTGVRRAQ